MRTLHLTYALLLACGPAELTPLPDAGMWPEEWAALEAQVLEETNQNRANGAACGSEVFAPAVALDVDARIARAARLHSLDMATEDYFDHTSLDGRTYERRMRDAGFNGEGPWGENVAAGPPDAVSVVQGWMESPEHCAVLMSPEFRVIGIGYAFEESSTFGHYWTQDFAASH